MSHSKEQPMWHLYSAIRKIEYCGEDRDVTRDDRFIIRQHKPGADQDEDTWPTFYVGEQFSMGQWQGVENGCDLFFIGEFDTAEQANAHRIELAKEFNLYTGGAVLPDVRNQQNPSEYSFIHSGSSMPAAYYGVHGAERSLSGFLHAQGWANAFQEGGSILESMFTKTIKHDGEDLILSAQISSHDKPGDAIAVTFRVHGNTAVELPELTFAVPAEFRMPTANLGYQQSNGMRGNHSDNSCLMSRAETLRYGGRFDLYNMRDETLNLSKKDHRYTHYHHMRDAFDTRAEIMLGLALSKNSRLADRVELANDTEHVRFTHDQYGKYYRVLTEKDWQGKPSPGNWCLRLEDGLLYEACRWDLRKGPCWSPVVHAPSEDFQQLYKRAFNTNVPVLDSEKSADYKYIVELKAQHGCYEVYRGYGSFATPESGVTYLPDPINQPGWDHTGSLAGWERKLQEYEHQQMPTQNSGSKQLGLGF